jgi:hypothetical protein
MLWGSRLSVCIILIPRVDAGRESHAEYCYYQQGQGYGKLLGPQVCLNQLVCPCPNL